MANICFTFEVDGLPVLVAFENEEIPWGRHRDVWGALVDGQPLLGPGSVVSMRRSTSDEIQAFIRLAADAFFAGRIDWHNAMEGYPIFLIKAADPDFPDDDINTGLRLDEVTAPRPPRAFGIPIEDLTALYAGVRSRQAQHAA